jgi:hypothetical protein
MPFSASAGPLWVRTGGLAGGLAGGLERAMSRSRPHFMCFIEAALIERQTRD